MTVRSSALLIYMVIGVMVGHAYHMDAQKGCHDVSGFKIAVASLVWPMTAFVRSTSEINNQCEITK